ncbi:MAG: hypothetical protein P8163_13895, partial [Candidatus Thiodiazotropha sp.]
LKLTFACAQGFHDRTLVILFHVYSQLLVGFTDPGFTGFGRYFQLLSTMLSTGAVGKTESFVIKRS